MPDEMRAEDAPFPMTTRHQTISERGQLALFWALPGDFAPRDAQDLMAYPFFSLSKSHRVTPIDFAAGNISIRVEAVADHGMATIWDADILIWAASQIVEARDAGLRTSRLMAATPYEILTFVRSWHLAARLSAPLRLSRSGDHEDACRLRGATRYRQVRLLTRILPLVRPKNRSPSRAVPPSIFLSATYRACPSTSTLLICRWTIVTWH
jgi:hypothetical protein